MKRFIVDLALILLLVMLGSTYMKEEDIDKKMDRFEQKIEEDVFIYEPSLNKATALAKGSSDVIENVVGMSVELITRFFSAIIE